MNTNINDHPKEIVSREEATVWEKTYWKNAPPEMRCPNGHIRFYNLEDGRCQTCLGDIRDKSDLEKLAENLVKNARASAMSKDRVFTITEEQIAEKLEKGVDEISGLKFKNEKETEEFIFRGKKKTPKGVKSRHINLSKASMDRKDSRKGYTLENTQLTFTGVNICKGEQTEHEYPYKLIAALGDLKVRVKQDDTLLDEYQLLRDLEELMKKYITNEKMEKLHFLASQRYTLQEENRLFENPE